MSDIGGRVKPIFIFRCCLILDRARSILVKLLLTSSRCLSLVVPLHRQHIILILILSTLSTLIIMIAITILHQLIVLRDATTFD